VGTKPRVGQPKRGVVAGWTHRAGNRAVRASRTRTARILRATGESGRRAGAPAEGVARATVRSGKRESSDGRIERATAKCERLTSASGGQLHGASIGEGIERATGRCARRWAQRAGNRARCTSGEHDVRATVRRARYGTGDAEGRLENSGRPAARRRSCRTTRGRYAEDGLWGRARKRRLREVTSRVEGSG